jgi:hypothetical protein
MMRYSFSIRLGDEAACIVRTAKLNDDTSALAYASELARSLQRSCENYAGWLIKISDERRPIVFALPILAACA